MSIGSPGRLRPWAVLVAWLLAGLQGSCGHPIASHRCDPVVCDAPDEDVRHPAAMLEPVFESHGSKLQSIVYVPTGPGPHPVVILLHGFPGFERNGDLAQALRRAGFSVVSFHYRGSWGSEGHFGFESSIEDAQAAVDFVQTAEFARAARADVRRIILVGHSMGGFVALEAAARRDVVACVASLAGANMGSLGAALEDPRRARQMAETMQGWLEPIEVAPGYDLLEELRSNAIRFDLTRLAPRLVGRPVLLVAGERDTVTPPAFHHEPLRAALEAAATGADDRLEAVTFDADHAFASHRIALGRAVVGFLDRHCR